jgi:integrase
MGWIRKAPSNRWQARWRDPVGHERVRTFRLKADAERWLTHVEDSKYAGTYLDPALGRVSFGRYLHDSLAAAMDLRPTTRALYETEARLYVLPALGSMPVSAIRPQDVRALLAGLLEQGKGLQTVQVVRRLVSRVLAQAVDDGLIAANPATRISLPSPERKPIRILSVEEVERLADSIDDRYRAAVMLGAYAGLRFGEVVALDRSALRLLERRIDVTQGASEVRGHVSIGPVKTAQGRRSIMIPSFLADELAVHLERAGGSELVFPAPSGEGPIRRTSWRQRFWQPAVRRAELAPAPTFQTCVTRRQRSRSARERTPRRSRNASVTRRSRPR